MARKLYPNDLVDRRFDQSGMNLAWTSDITYLSTELSWLYLLAVRDGSSATSSVTVCTPMSSRPHGFGR